MCGGSPEQHWRGMVWPQRLATCKEWPPHWGWVHLACMARVRFGARLTRCSYAVESGWVVASPLQPCEVGR